MLVVCECIDDTSAGEIRAAKSDAHRTYLGSQRDPPRAAGPLSNEDGAPRGSLLIVEAEDAQGERDFVDGDPFEAADAFSEVQYEQFKPTINNLG